MKVIQSPHKATVNTSESIFLAGGISNCPNWQSEIINMLDNKINYDSVTIVNPRRMGDLAKNGEDAKAQILWEHHYLAKVWDILFWFPEETVCPITLFELGKYVQLFCEFYKKSTLIAADHLFIGIHPNYSRKFDLEIQLPLMIPDIKIYNTLEDLSDAVARRYNR